MTDYSGEEWRDIERDEDLMIDIEKDDRVLADVAAEAQRKTIMAQAEQLDAQRQEIARLKAEHEADMAQLLACRQVLTQALLDDARHRGRAAVAAQAIRGLGELVAIPAEVTDLIECLT